MSNSVENVLRRADLIQAGDEMVASGVFQFSGATYSVQFTNEAGLLECLDLMMSRTQTGDPMVHSASARVGTERTGSPAVESPVRLRPRP
jgi:hypothetical protein